LNSEGMIKFSFGRISGVWLIGPYIDV
jgi:hypothetical protein